MTRSAKKVCVVRKDPRGKHHGTIFEFEIMQDRTEQHSRHDLRIVRCGGLLGRVTFKILGLGLGATYKSSPKKTRLRC